jgi:hypothetical protein
LKPLVDHTFERQLVLLRIFEQHSCPLNIGMAEMDSPEIWIIKDRLRVSPRVYPDSLLRQVRLISCSLARASGSLSLACLGFPIWNCQPFLGTPAGGELWRFTAT